MTSSAGAHAGDMMERLTGEVLASLRDTPDPRLREVVEALVRYLHEFAREDSLSEPELMSGVAFLTDTGRASNDVRQEFILLSDTLGFSSLVNLLDHSSDDPTVTAPTILGPFYAPESPWREPGSSTASPGEPGEPAVLRDQLRSTDGRALPGAVLDVWQTSANGSHPRDRHGERPPPADDSRVRRGQRLPGQRQHFGVVSSLVRDFVPTPDGEAVCSCDVVLEPLSTGVMTAGGRVSGGVAWS